jgi:adenine-specific DNA-methyltransferase
MGRKKSEPKPESKPKAKAKAATPPVEAIRHQDTRKNIPTEELRDFVSGEEDQPPKMLYPRDPSLDPQLVWKGKDEQDQADLAVDVVPIYIQEAIEPRVIVESVLARKPTGPDNGGFLPGFYEDLNRVDFEKRVEFYQHDHHWANRMILGNSLHVMTSLSEKEGLKGKVQTVYMDPPYGIKFGSNWQVSTRRKHLNDGKLEDTTRQPEQIQAFRDTWRLGIHSYLSYLRDRLVVARGLLTESGSVFLQIGEENVHFARCLLDEVFGSRNSVVTILLKKKGSQKSGLVDPVNDYILWYSKTSRDDSSGTAVKYRPLLQSWGLDRDTLEEFRYAELPDGRVFPVSEIPGPDGSPSDYRSAPDRLTQDHPGVRMFRANPLTSGGERTNQSLPFAFGRHKFSPPLGSCWKHTARRVDDNPCGMERLAYADRLIAAKTTWRFKSYLDDYGFKPMSNWWDGLGGASDPIYVVQTNTEVVKRCILMTTDPGDIVLDPTCGSGTTAYIAEQWGRRWITIDTSRVALALARTRLMAARFPYYLLADSPEGLRKEAELARRNVLTYETGRDVRKGFVNRRVPHITSGAIANNPEIREGMTPAQINAAIARHADTETLHDQPYEDNARIRVSGPFTVESLSPDRIVSPEEERPSAESVLSASVQNLLMPRSLGWSGSACAGGPARARRRGGLAWCSLSQFASSPLRLVPGHNRQQGNPHSTTGRKHEKDEPVPRSWVPPGGSWGAARFVVDRRQELSGLTSSPRACLLDTSPARPGTS